MALDIRYARNGGVAIAYQVVGDGETDLAYVPDFVSTWSRAFAISGSSCAQASTPVAGNGLPLEDRGERELKGVPGSWRLYRAISE